MTTRNELAKQEKLEIKDKSDCNKDHAEGNNNKDESSDFNKSSAQNLGLNERSNSIMGSSKEHYDNKHFRIEMIIPTKNKKKNPELTKKGKKRGRKANKSKPERTGNKLKNKQSSSDYEICYNECSSDDTVLVNNNKVRLHLGKIPNATKKLIPLENGKTRKPHDISNGKHQRINTSKGQNAGSKPKEVIIIGEESEEEGQGKKEELGFKEKVEVRKHFTLIYLYIYIFKFIVLVIF